MWCILSALAGMALGTLFGVVLVSALVVSRGADDDAMKQ